MIIPYFHFQGNCEEALHFYADAFGGKIEYLSRYTEVTGGPALAGKVMHAEVSLGDYGRISGGDQLEAAAFDKGINFMIHCATSEEAELIFDNLAKQGHEISRLKPHPPPDDGGMGATVQDRYGLVWIITAPNDRKRDIN